MAANPARTEKAEVARPSTFELMCRTMGLRARVEADDNSAVVHQVEAIYEADSEEEMWQADERPQIGGRDLADVEQIIYGFTVKYGSGDDDDVSSDFKDPETGRDLYLLVEAARLDNGEPIIWNTSASGIVSKLDWLDRHGAFPRECVIREIKLSGRRTKLKLQPVPKRAVQATLA